MDYFAAKQRSQKLSFLPFTQLVAFISSVMLQLHTLRVTANAQQDHPVPRISAGRLRLFDNTRSTLACLPNHPCCIEKNGPCPIIPLSAIRHERAPSFLSPGITLRLVPSAVLVGLCSEASWSDLRMSKRLNQRTYGLL